MIVLITVWCLMILALVIWLPRKNIRHALVIFFFKQFMTWILGLTVVELGLITYPVREFKKASHTSFSFEYFIYPAICVLFNLYYPHGKSLARRIGWFLLFPTWMTILEVMIEHHTKLIDYIHWTWYWTWLSLFITFVFSFLFYHWFFKLKLR